MSAGRAAHAPPPRPDISIRAKPPSPRRLSRKVLLGGALVMASIIAFAVLYGLSERPDRRQVAEAQGVAASGPPDSIRMAPQNYGAADLGANAGALPEEISADVLAPPEGEERGSVRTAPPVREAPAAPDPERTAQVAPILFSAAGDAPNSTGAASPDAGRHGAFLASQRGGEDRLEARLAPPRSRYEVLAGAVIAAALQSELNSDLPGRVIAQVTAPVFDSVTGRHLLIPQGARLIGAYDSATAYGDRRLLLVWNRLILPNGWSINLQGMEGADASGAAGVRDRTDNHLARLTGAVALSAIISVVANQAEDDDQQSLTRTIGDAAAQEAARTGGRIVDRELSVRPTLRVRAGAPVRVLVTRDIVLRPYRQ
ncbi:MAG: TrbI/VirB10 family protein [Hyphomonadaceae bacterium]|nr:TrbI/VirB10 family protein [Hyphomonadaceae bacterium]